MRLRRNALVTGISIAAAAVLIPLVIFIIRACTPGRNGEEVYIINIFASEGRWYCLRPDQEKPEKEITLNLVGEDGNETVIRSFSWGGQPYYSPDDQLFYFLEKNELRTIDPEDGSEKTVCRIDKNSKQIDTVTKDHVLIRRRDNSVYLIDLNAAADGEDEVMRSVSCSYDMFTGGVSEGSVVLWDNDSKDLLMYDCGSDSSELIYHEDLNTSGYYKTLLLDDRLLCFDNRTGILRQVELFSKDQEVPPAAVEEMEGIHVIAAIPLKEGILCAARAAGSPSRHYAVNFYLLGSDGTVRQTGSWEDAGYYLDGSLKLAASEDSFACCVSTGQDIYYGKLNAPE